MIIEHDLGGWHTALGMFPRPGRTRERLRVIWRSERKVCGDRILVLADKTPPVRWDEPHGWTSREVSCPNCGNFHAPHHVSITVLDPES